VRASALSGCSFAGEPQHRERSEQLRAGGPRIDFEAGIYVSVLRALNGRCKSRTPDSVTAVPMRDWDPSASAAYRVTKKKTALRAFDGSDRQSSIAAIGCSAIAVRAANASEVSSRRKLVVGRNARGQLRCRRTCRTGLWRPDAMEILRSPSSVRSIALRCQNTASPLATAVHDSKDGRPIVELAIFENPVQNKIVRGLLLPAGG